MLPLGLALMVQGSGLLGAATAAPADASSAAAARAEPTGAADQTAPARGVARVRPASADAPAAGGQGREPLLDAAPPTGITVDAMGVKARVVPIEVTPDGVLDPPGDVSLVGWWQRSAPIAARGGQTVLTGHSVHGGGGVFDDLESLSRGDFIRTFHDGALVRYRVRRVHVWSKAELAERAAEVFAQDRADGRLVLVTCEGWDGAEWASNVVVTARQLRPQG